MSKERREARNQLQPGQILFLSSNPSGRAPERYQICGYVGEGGSCICYEAARLRDMRVGILKEFYPLDAVSAEEGRYGTKTPRSGQTQFYAMRRLPDNRLVPGPGTVRQFDAMCERYIRSYKLLNRVIAEDPRNEVLKNYIQSGEVLYGSSGEDMTRDMQPSSTVYIWNDGQAGMDFDRFLNQIRRNPRKMADVYLDQIVDAMISLTDCIKALHTAGLLHMDIKPSNFMLSYNSEQEFNGQNISMFDIDTLYDIRSDDPVLAGTPGYCAPEILDGRMASDRSDIYSIGAVLFHALVITEEVPEGLYSRERRHYRDFDRLLRSSELIAASHSAQNDQMLSELVGILKKCLAYDPRKRYGSAAELLRDLRQIKLHTELYGSQARYLGANQALAIVTRDEQGNNNPIDVVQKVLFDHPLFEVLQPSDEQLRVLVVGIGGYGQAFISQCLQVGQLHGHSLQILAVSNTPQVNSAQFLQQRPELPRFVRINGQDTGSDYPPYAKLDFSALPSAGSGAGFRLGDDRLNREILRQLMKKTEQPHYIFIALGNDQLNAEIAALFGAVLQENACPVCFIMEDSEADVPTGGRLYPISIDKRITAQNIHPQLENMAFRTFLSWSGNDNNDIAKLLDRFYSQEYDRQSSLASALAVPYKLYSCGILWQNGDLAIPKDPSVTVVANEEEAARAFSEKILDRMDLDPEAKRKFDILVALEHRRWVLNMICGGWSSPRNEQGERELQDCIACGKARIDRDQKHACLLYSTAATPLEAPAYTQGDRPGWEDPQIDPELDELDRLSVQLYQLFRQKGEEFKRTNPLQSEDLEAIWKLVSGCGETAVRAWKQMLFCLKQILDGSERQTRQYPFYRDQLLDALPDEQIRSRVGERLRLVDKAFIQVKAANNHMDYKTNDRSMIRQMPFILTYKINPALAVSFADGTGETALFSNVAAATVLSAGRIVYFTVLQPEQNAARLCQQLLAVRQYLRTRMPRCGVSFVLLVQTQNREALRSSLEALPGGSDLDYVLLPCDTMEDAAEQIISRLRQEKIDLVDAGTGLSAGAEACGSFRRRLQQEKLPWFAFDWRRKKFTGCSRCNYLHYLNDRSYLRINDMVALLGAGQTAYSLPEFAEDHEALWQAYSGRYLEEPSFEEGNRIWYGLCEGLQAYEKRRLPLAVFTPGVDSGCLGSTLVYILPEYARHGAQRLLREMTGLGIISERSHLNFHSSETCRLELFPLAGEKADFDRIFYHPQQLLRFYDTHCVRLRDRVEVRTEEMRVEGLDLTGCPELRPLLEQLEKIHGIYDLHGSPEHPMEVGFSYSCGGMKALLTDPGEILRACASYTLLQTGYFDDLACGCECRWTDSGEKETFDLVLTKGFQTVLIKCASRQEADFSHCENRLDACFGAGAVRLLLGGVRRKDLGHAVQVTGETALENLGPAIRSLLS